MPISADRFEEIDNESSPTPGTNAHDIVSFLESHPEQAFTQGEIAEATDVTRGSVGPTLSRLREAGRVDHKENYWRISDHVRSVGAATGHAGDEDEPMLYEEWQEHAIDPRENRD